VAPEAWSWVALGGRGAVAAQASSGGWRWGMELTAERRSVAGWKARTKREDVFPVKTRPTRELGGPAGTVSAYGGGAASGLAGPEAEWAARSAGPNIRKKKFLN
jgi:hypothetical protein